MRRCWPPSRAVGSRPSRESECWPASDSARRADAANRMACRIDRCSAIESSRPSRSRRPDRYRLPKVEPTPLPGVNDGVPIVRSAPKPSRATVESFFLRDAERSAVAEAVSCIGRQAVGHSVVVIAAGCAVAAPIPAEAAAPIRPPARSVAASSAPRPARGSETLAVPQLLRRHPCCHGFPASISSCCADRPGGGSDDTRLTGAVAGSIGRTPYRPNKVCLGGTTRIPYGPSGASTLARAALRFDVAAMGVGVADQDELDRLGERLGSGARRPSGQVQLLDR